MAKNLCRPIAALFFLCIILLGGVGEIGVLSWKLCAGCSQDDSSHEAGHGGRCQAHGSAVPRCPISGIPEHFCCGRCKPEKERTVLTLPPSITFRFTCPAQGEEVALRGFLSTEPIHQGTGKRKTWKCPPLVPPPKGAVVSA